MTETDSFWMDAFLPELDEEGIPRVILTPISDPSGSIVPQAHRRKAEVRKPFDPRWIMVENFFSSKSLTANTKRSYRREIRRFLEWTKLDWQDIKSHHLADYKDYLHSVRPLKEVRKRNTDPASLSPSTINLALCTLKSFYAWFAESHANLIKDNPTSGLEFETLGTPPPQHLTPEQMDKVWQALEVQGETQLRNRALVHLLVHGLRAGEAVSLNVGSYNGATVSIAKSKNKDSRIVPLCSAARQAISAYIETLKNQTADAPLLISCHPPGSHGQRLTYAGVYEAVARLGEISGIEGLHPHQFRHTFATDILLKGLAPLHAQRLTGHRHYKSFRRYIVAVEQEVAVNEFFRVMGESD